MPNLRRDKLGRTDGGASRLFNHSGLGSLISACHSGIIKAGNELEAIVERHAVTMDAPTLKNFLAGNVKTGVWLIPKKIIKTYLKQELRVKNEPDFVMLIISETSCYVIELKDGDTFDTKKSDGELQSLRTFSEALKRRLPDYKVFIRVVSFNATNKSQIVAGLKNRITAEEAWTGLDFCMKLGISFENIVKERLSDCDDNISFFLEQLLEFPDIRARVSRLLQGAQK